MPVVNRDLQFPADWVRPAVSIGLIRDGDSVRVWIQPRKGGGRGGVVNCAEWGSDALIQEVRRAVEKGAWVVVGLAPHRGLVRSLSSPLNDLQKSAEIWPSLLDAELPFALEECAVAFLPPEKLEQGGVRCLACAVRESDLREARSEWEELGVKPDLMVPEVLLLSRDRESRLWRGQYRFVMTAWNGGEFLGGAGGGAGARREKAIHRFQTTWRSAYSEISWAETGPEAGREEQSLEQTAARIPHGSFGLEANMLAGAGVQTRVVNRYRKKQKTLRVAVLLLLLILMLGPLSLRGRMRNYQAVLRQEIAREYLGMTGSQSPAAGQEVLLARRFLDEALEGVVLSRREVSGPGVSVRLFRVFDQLNRQGLVCIRVEAHPGEVRLEALGTEEQALEFQKGMENYQEQVVVGAASNGCWVLRVSPL